jgi:type IX secretion system PorP/SprF family membrane protein
LSAKTERNGGFFSKHFLCHAKQFIFALPFPHSIFLSFWFPKPHCMQLKNLHLLALAALFLAPTFISAQDIHFTQFTMSPLTLNPANTGRFEGTVRLGGIYRSQWTKILSSNQFETPSFWVDAPVIRGFRKQDWVGAGVMLFQEGRTGVGGLRHGAQKLSATYHIGLNKKGTSSLAVGFQWGNESYRAGEGFEFESQYGSRDLQTGVFTAHPGGTNAGLNQQVFDDPRRFSTFGGGLVLTSRLNKTTDFNVGFALFNAGTPRFQSLISSDTSSSNPGTPQPTQAAQFNQPRRAVFHGTFNVKTSDRMTISPSFIYQTTAAQDEIMVQALGGYLFNPERDITLQAGLGYRLGDAINVLVGAKVKDLRVGLAYDINTSELSSDTNYRGGFELAANYIIRIYKKSVTKPKVLCPRF